MNPLQHITTPSPPPFLAAVNPTPRVLHRPLPGAWGWCHWNRDAAARGAGRDWSKPMNLPCDWGNWITIHSPAILGILRVSRVSGFWPRILWSPWGYHGDITEDNRFWKHGQGSGNIFEMPVNQWITLCFQDGRNGICRILYIYMGHCFFSYHNLIYPI